MMSFRVLLPAVLLVEAFSPAAWPAVAEVRLQAADPAAASFGPIIVSQEPGLPSFTSQFTIASPAPLDTPALAGIEATGPWVIAIHPSVAIGQAAAAPATLPAPIHAATERLAPADRSPSVAAGVSAEDAPAPRESLVEQVVGVVKDLVSGDAGPDGQKNRLDKTFDANGAGAGAGVPVDPGTREDEGLPAVAPFFAVSKVFFPKLGSNRFLHSFRGPKDKDPGVLALMEAMSGANGRYVVLVTPSENGGTAQNHHPTATLVRVKDLKSESDGYTVVFEAVREAKLEGYGDGPDGRNFARLSYTERGPSDPAQERALLLLAKDYLGHLQYHDQSMNEAFVRDVKGLDDPERAGNLLSQELAFPLPDRQRLLSAPSTEARLGLLVELMLGLKLDGELATATKVALEREQQEMLLRAKLKTIQERLGDDGQADLVRLREQVEASGMSDEARKAALETLKRLEGMSALHPETAGLKDYVKLLVELPWGKRSQDNLDLANAQQILEKRHYGLRQVKERVLEYLAGIKRLREKRPGKPVKGKILLFDGPAGTGKTSIAKAIADAMGRPFVRIALGGVRDEAKIRGHERAYMHAKAGEIILALKKAGVMNPVVLLDEVDKLTEPNVQGDPSAALLEVTDPEQNHAFKDNYLGVPFDLSEVLFIASSNELSKISPILLDRFKVVPFHSYTLFEKIKIALGYAVPEKMEEAALSADEAVVTEGAIRRIIEEYTHEGGVRGLRGMIEDLISKIVAWLEGGSAQAPMRVEAQDVEKYLGVPPYSLRQVRNNGVGVATGLAVRGDIGGVPINYEVVGVPGKGKLILRKMMKEDSEDAAETAFDFVRSHAQELDIDLKRLETIDLSVNKSPAGTVDGPSAGITKAFAIASYLSNRAIKPDVAMTGEITLDGRILPIGGLREKVMAAHRSGYKTVVFPAGNQKDVADIPEEVRSEIELVPVRAFQEAIPHVLSSMLTPTAADVEAILHPHPVGGGQQL